MIQGGAYDLDFYIQLRDLLGRQVNVLEGISILGQHSQDPVTSAPIFFKISRLFDQAVTVVNRYDNG